MKRILFALLFIPSLCWAAPTISTVSDSTPTDGQSITITSGASDFGTNALNYEWTGANIEEGTPGNNFSKTGWTVGTEYSGNPHKYATDQAHSGSQSLKGGPYSDYAPYGGNLSGADIWFSGQTVGAGGVVVVSWWVRRVHTGQGQWKMLRIQENRGVVDAGYEQVWFNHDDGTGHQLFTRNTTSNCASGGVCDYDAEYPTADAVWYRIELTMHTSSASGGDGSYTQILYTPGSTRLSDSKTSTTNWSTSGHSYNYYNWQNWAGNDLTEQTSWMDDVFIQSGTVARVELCDTSTWTARTSCDIQPATAWSAGSVTVDFNAGGFAESETAYLYVVDSTGAVNSSGYAVTLSGGAATPGSAGSSPAGTGSVGSNVAGTGSVGCSP